MSDDNLYPLNLGNTIEPSATLQAWGYRRDLGEAQKIELARRYEQIKDIVLGRSPKYPRKYDGQK